MTLGPKFYACSVPVTNLSKIERQKSRALILKALDAYYAVALSKDDLKHPGTFFSEKLHATLDSQVTFCMDVCPKGPRATKARNLQWIQITNRHMRSITKYMILKSFYPFSKA